MKCKNCGRKIQWGIDPDEYLVAELTGDDKKNIEPDYYHEYPATESWTQWCWELEPDYKFKDYIKRCKRNARSVKSQ